MPSYDGLFIQIILKLEVFSQLLCECCHGDAVTHDNCEIGMKVETTVRLVDGGLDRSIPAGTRGRVKAHYKEDLIKGKKDTTLLRVKWHGDPCTWSIRNMDNLIVLDH